MLNSNLKAERMTKSSGVIAEFFWQLSLIFHTIAIVPTLSVCINSEQNKLSPLRVFKPQTPKVQVFEADDIPISHRASLLFVLSPLAEQVCTGFCSVQRTTDFTKIRHPYLGE